MTWPFRCDFKPGETLKKAVTADWMQTVSNILSYLQIEGYTRKHNANPSASNPWIYQINPESTEFNDGRFFTGRVCVLGKWQYDPEWELDPDAVFPWLESPYLKLNTDPEKPYVRADYKTLTATEEAGPMPLDGEKDAAWKRKGGTYGDMHFP